MEKLKDIYNDETLINMASKFKEVYENFDIDKFIILTKEGDWELLELKQRYTKLAVSFYQTLNLPFDKACEILIGINDKCQGFKYMFLPEIVAIYGMDDIEISLKTLEVLTTGSSAEFAIREFLTLDFEKTFNKMKEWAKSSNEHVRRLASEGLRVKLPWGKQVKELYNYPLEIIEVLELLKEDDSLYVRKSVANNLNDLSKSFPFLIFKVCKNWIGKSEKTDWIIKRGARTLINHGDRYILDLFGYKNLQLNKVKLASNKNYFKLNEEAIFKIELNVKGEGKLRVNLRISFKNKTGYSNKIFHIYDKYIDGNIELSFNKKYVFQDRTIRKHYNGEQTVCLIINGKEYKKIKIYFNR